MDKPIRTELVIGGQKSGKSRRAEELAQCWIAQSPQHRAILIATAQAWDGEMQQRIARHQQDRGLRVPEMQTVEEPIALAQAIRQHSHANTMVVVDCLTLWLTNLLMPAKPQDAVSLDAVFSPNNMPKALVNNAQAAMLSVAISESDGPVVLVSNDIGWGVIPLGSESRQFVDAMGRLNQEIAQVCDRVTLMVAGCPLHVKGTR